MKTRITEMFNIQYPLVCPGMTYVANADLVAATSNAGGLGILAIGHLNPEETLAEIRKVKSLTNKPFGIGCALIMPGARENLEVALNEKVPVINFSLGSGADVCKRVHEYGGKVIATVVNAKHALKAEQAGVDALLVTGHEAAAHGGAVTSLVLVPAIRQVTKLPIIAAGGFGTGGGVVAAHRIVGIGEIDQLGPRRAGHVQQGLGVFVIAPVGHTVQRAAKACHVEIEGRITAERRDDRHAGLNHHAHHQPQKIVDAFAELALHVGHHVVERRTHAADAGHSRLEGPGRHGLGIGRMAACGGDAVGPLVDVGAGHVQRHEQAFVEQGLEVLAGAPRQSFGKQHQREVRAARRRGAGQRQAHRGAGAAGAPLNALDTGP